MCRELGYAGRVWPLLLSLLLLTACGVGDTGRQVTIELAHTISGQGPVVVLLHGHPQTAASWRTVVPRLAASHRVIVVDLRGQGASPAPEDGYHSATRAADVAELLDRLGVARAAVVGTDLGGQVAYALARDAPGLVTRLAVLEAVIPGTAAASGPLAAPHIARHADVEAMVSATRGRERQHVEEFVCGERRPCPYPPDLLADAASALARPGYLRGAFTPYQELARPARDPGRIDLPVLTIGGEKGVGNLPARSLREVADDVSEVVLPGASHWLAEEHPEELLAALEPFLADTNSPAVDVDQ